MKELGSKEAEEQLLEAADAHPTARARLWLKYKTFVIVFLVTSSVIFAQAYSSGFKFANCSQRKLTYEERATKILSKHPLIDGHNDLLILLRGTFKNHIYGDDFKKSFEEGGLPGHVDVPRIEKGKYGGAFWSAFMPCPRNVTDFSDENYAWTTKATLEQIDTFNRLATLYPKYFTLTPDAAAAEKAFADDKLISPIIIEGLHQIGNSVSLLRLYHQLGVRYATLTWNCHNKYADAALITDLVAGETVASTPLWHGLSTAGSQLITEMNRLGMIVDLSHVSKNTMVDVLGGNPSKTNGSLAPPIFSHSSAYGVCPHPRNVQDDVLDLVKKRKSLVMVNFSPSFVACTPSNSSTGLPDDDPENATLDQVVKHITYIGDRIGYDHVGIGTDYDGIETTPEGLEDVSKFPDLVAALLKAGVSDEDAAKVVGRNLLRVWHEVDRVAKELQKSLLPLEDDIFPW